MIIKSESGSRGDFTPSPHTIRRRMEAMAGQVLQRRINVHPQLFDDQAGWHCGFAVYHPAMGYYATESPDIPFIM